MKYYIILIVSVFDVYGISYVTVNTTVGKIRGVLDEYVSFKGIPYGDLDENYPFEPARPFPPFKTTLEANTDLSFCPQLNNRTFAGDINCLFLNIYTPPPKDNALWPVMVYIFGGNFTNGTGMKKFYDPKWLVRRGVIIVTINYRVGLFGFLCIKGDKKYANQGLKDQELAMRWVKKNIESFGGDSNNIVLFGHSAGAASVDIHLLYNSDKNLFNKVIIQSGNAESPYVCIENTSNDFHAVYNVTEKSWNKTGIIDLIYTARNYRFGPCVDGEYITKYPKAKSLEHIKIMTGRVDSEMEFEFMIHNKSYYESYNFVYALSKGFGEMAGNMTDVIKKIKSYYGIEKDVNKIVDFASDFFFNYPFMKAIRFYLEKNATIWRYHFSYMGKRNYMKCERRLPTNRTTHGDELGYLYDILNRFYVEEKDIDAEDLLVIDTMTKLWTDFAKYGQPPNWEPTTIDNPKYLLINNHTPVILNGPDDRLEFWDNIYQNYGNYSVTVDTQMQYIQNEKHGFRNGRHRRRKMKNNWNYRQHYVNSKARDLVSKFLLLLFLCRYI